MAYTEQRVHTRRRAMPFGSLLFWLFLCPTIALEVSVALGDERGLARDNDRMLAAYFRAETQRLQDRCLADIETLDDWKAKRSVYKKQLLEMLGLDPLPQKTPLQAMVTGGVEHDEFTVENLHFQSSPGLYVTANLYIPKDLSEPAPAVLYVCGHGAAKQDGISYGNKVRYQHHAAWFARHGYVCLIIDTLQLGEIEGIHHGTYRYKSWWWNSRGYTPAGVEAWNCIRALDYLETREEVDSNRIGVTGRSGGGAYSWWIAAIDERIKAAVPVAGITDLQNHVVDGCVEGHCDCMYIVNTYRWDYPTVAALVAPRPLLISNSDKDRIFPLDGVIRVHEKVRRIYQLHDAAKNLGLQVTEGPHKDTQELRVHAFVWFNRFLKDQNPLIAEPAVPFFEPGQLKVFDELPSDQINTKIHETFVPKARPLASSRSSDGRVDMHGQWMTTLREKVFRGWPDEADAGLLGTRLAFSARADGLHLAAFDFTSQPHVPLRLFVVTPADGAPPRRVTLSVLDEPDWTRWLAAMRHRFAKPLSRYDLPPSDPVAFERMVAEVKSKRIAWAAVAPRGIGPGAWGGDERKHTHIRRRFMLLGQTLDGMRAWDVRRAVQALGRIDATRDRPAVLAGRGTMAGIALYAALFEPDVERLELRDVPDSHRQGPIFLNVLRFLDMPQALKMAAASIDVQIDADRDHVP